MSPSHPVVMVTGSRRLGEHGCLSHTQTRAGLSIAEGALIGTGFAFLNLSLIPRLTLNPSLKDPEKSDGLKISPESPNVHKI